MNLPACHKKMIGGKMSGGKLEKLLNDHASQGWQLKAITGADVNGRIGPGGTEGLLVTFERRIGVGPLPQSKSRWTSVHPQPAVTGSCRCSRLGVP